MLPSIPTLQFNIAITFLCSSQELGNLAQLEKIYLVLNMTKDSLVSSFGYI